MGRRIISTEEHHRRPRSVGGTNAPSNISYVPAKKHKFYHTIFGDLNIYQSADKINAYFRPRGFLVYAKLINGDEVKKEGVGHDSKNLNKLIPAWDGLFGKEASFEECIAELNSKWIDPSYHLYIRKI
jgi:hypothetical protein